MRWGLEWDGGAVGVRKRERWGLEEKEREGEVRSGWQAVKLLRKMSGFLSRRSLASDSAVFSWKFCFFLF